jgi:hypothetical protein
MCRQLLAQLSRGACEISEVGKGGRGCNLKGQDRSPSELTKRNKFGKTWRIEKKSMPTFIF